MSRFRIKNWRPGIVLNVMFGSWVLSLVVMIYFAFRLRLYYWVTSFSTMALENIAVFGVGEAIAEYVGYKWSSAHSVGKKSIHWIMIGMAIGYVLIIFILLFLFGTKYAI